MNPFDLLWGVDVAIKKLRPGARFQLTNSNITEWDDPNGLPPPTWGEINEQIAKDKAAYNEYHGIVEAEPEPYIKEEDVIPTPLSTQRLNICKGCDRFISTFKICRECGCFMPLKTRLSDTKCPIGNW